MEINEKRWTVLAYTEEYGHMLLTHHIGRTKQDVSASIMTTARKEGFDGNIYDRLRELRWEIVEVNLSYSNA